MIDSILLVSRQVGVLFALMAVGFLCNKRRLLDETAVKGMTELLVLVVTPCIIVHSFLQQTFAPSLLGDLGWALAASAFAQVAGTVLAVIFLRGGDPRREGVMRFAVVFSNAGFMGIPLENALLGADGVFFGAMYVVVFNLTCWSLGVAMMCRGAGGAGWRSLLVNPGTVGVSIGLPLFLFSVEIPEVAARPVEMLADLNTPLAMIMAGWYLAKTDLRAVLRRRAAYGVAVLRLVAAPIAVVGALAGLRMLVPALNPTMCEAVTIAAAAPVAALTTVIAARYDRDVSTATGLVAGTTLLSIATMPPIVGFAMWLFGR